MKENYIIATVKSWNIQNARKFIKKHNGLNVYLVTDKDKFNLSFLCSKHPRYVFIPHWSWLIPPEIYNNFDCVVFHMTDLPFGRGGSPLQNLILKGMAKTKITAIKAVKEIDAGPIYLKRNLSLVGSAEEIYRKASEKIFEEMIPYLIKNMPKPFPQKGKVSVFKRRTPCESKIPEDVDLNKAYDYIRMLDAEGYPPAFIENKSLRFEFKGAQKKENSIKAQVYITRR